jgi:hypothetical protein
MRQLKRIIVGHDLGGGGEVALGSAVALANRCGTALRLVHVVEPLDAYQRFSHPLTSPCCHRTSSEARTSGYDRYGHPR